MIIDTTTVSLYHQMGCDYKFYLINNLAYFTYGFLHSNYDFKSICMTQHNLLLQRCIWSCEPQTFYHIIFRRCVQTILCTNKFVNCNYNLFWHDMMSSLHEIFGYRPCYPGSVMYSWCRNDTLMGPYSILF